MNKTLPQQNIELLDKANKDIASLNQILKMERELYVNVRELAKSRHREINELKELFQTAMELSKKYKDERDEYKIGHDRYEKLRRLNLQQIKELYLKNLRTGEHFDTLVDKLCQVK